MWYNTLYNKMMWYEYLKFLVIYVIASNFCFVFFLLYK